MKIKKILKSSVLLLMDISGINILYRWINRDKAIIIMYHGICEGDFDVLSGYDERHLPKSSFRKQIKYLKDKGYSLISMAALVDKIERGQKLGKNVVLTFDDGFQNVVDNAYPIMRELNVKGCFFLVSGLTGTDQLLWTDEVETAIRNAQGDSFKFSFKGEKIEYQLGGKFLREQAMDDVKAKLRTLPNKERWEHLKQFETMEKTDTPDEFKITDWEQIKELDPEIMEIGCHSRSHPNCGNLTSDDEIKEEIVLSKKEIEAKLGKEVHHFCYPAGSYNQRIADEVRQSGCKSAVTVKGGFVENDSDLFKLNRMTPDKSFILFKTRISGSNQLFRFIRLFKGSS